jgi:hypothetical protein
MTIQDQIDELADQNADLEAEVAVWRERAQKAERQAQWLTLQLLFQKQLVEGHKLLGDASVSIRDAALRLAGEDA